MKRTRSPSPNNYYYSTSSTNNHRQPLPPQSQSHYQDMSTPYRGRGRGASRGGRGSSRGGGFSNSSRSTAAIPSPSAPPPIHSSDYILHSLYQQLTGNPRAVVGQKYVENPKGVIANYLKALGEDVKYTTKKVRVDGVELWR